MDTLTSLGDEISIVPRETALKPGAGRGRRVARRLGAAGLAGVAALVMVVASLAVVNSVRESRREQCALQLKKLGRAMLDFNEKSGHFPAPAIASPDRQLLSWRVALLPYLGYQSLYERFRLDEPWDSPHNRALLAEMPSEFACPSGPGRRQGLTGYLVVVGPMTEFGSVNTAFEPTRGVDIREIIDGTSNTVLVFETDTAVPWTKPDDLRWAPGWPLPKLASPHAGGTHMLFADGTTRFIKHIIEPNKLLGLLTINGGEVLSSG